MSDDPDRIPSAQEVREAYQLTGDGLDFKRVAARRGEEFDAWLAVHEAGLRADLVDQLRAAADELWIRSREALEAGDYQMRAALATKAFAYRRAAKFIESSTD